MGSYVNYGSFMDPGLDNPDPEAWEHGYDAWKAYNPHDPMEQPSLPCTACGAEDGAWNGVQRLCEACYENRPAPPPQPGEERDDVPF